MGIGISLLLIAAGAVLTWAVEFDVSGISIHLIGVILMVVGVIGLLISMILLASGDRRAVVREEY
jgi:Domain of unknown function (DUF6458)